MPKFKRLCVQGVPRQVFKLLFQEEIQTLIRSGLTSCQARIYLALVRSGTSTAKAISEASGVRREEVYRIIPKLQKLGLVEKIISSPIRFNALPIREGFSVLQKHRNKETSELNTKIKELLQNFKKNDVRMTIHEEYPQFVLLPKKNAAINRRNQQIEAAQTSIDAIVTFNRLRPWAFAFQEVTKKALERGVKIRAISEKPENENEIPQIIQDFEKNPCFKIRYISGPPSTILTIYDGKEIGKVN